MSVTAVRAIEGRATVPRRIILSLVVGLGGGLAGACASASSGGSGAIVQSWDLEADYETAWEAAVASVRDFGFEVESAEPAANRLLTDWRSFSSDVGSSRCGERYWGRVEVRLREVGDRVRISITPTFHGGERAEVEEAPRCPTNGRLERSLSRLVINRVTPG